jgi:hypothetical protein
VRTQRRSLRLTFLLIVHRIHTPSIRLHISRVPNGHKLLVGGRPPCFELVLALCRFCFSSLFFQVLRLKFRSDPSASFSQETQHSTKPRPRRRTHGGLSGTSLAPLPLLTPPGLLSLLFLPLLTTPFLSSLRLCRVEGKKGLESRRYKEKTTATKQ